MLVGSYLISPQKFNVISKTHTDLQNKRVCFKFNSTYIEFDYIGSINNLEIESFTIVQRIVRNIKIQEENKPIQIFNYGYFEHMNCSFLSHESSFANYKKYFIPYFPNSKGYGITQLSTSDNIVFSISNIFNVPNFCINKEISNINSVLEYTPTHNIQLDISILNDLDVSSTYGYVDGDCKTFNYLHNNFEYQRLKINYIRDTKTFDLDFVIALTGQSNSQGALALYEFDKIEDQSDDRIFGWNSVTGSWEIADLRTESLGAEYHGKLKHWQSLAFHFAKTMLQAYPELKIGIINVGLGGNSISRWTKFSPNEPEYHISETLSKLSWNGTPGDLFDIHNFEIKRSLSKINKKSVDVVLWHQGEQDGFDVSGVNMSEYYQKALENVIHSYRSQEYSHEHTPFIVGETSGGFPGYRNGWEARNRELNIMNEDEDPYTKCVKCSDLECLEDKVHFTSKSQRIMGKRYFKAFRSIYSEE